MIGIERATWVQVDGLERVSPICNEDLARETETKTSSVHFMRFELSPEMVEAAKQGAEIFMGIEHPYYCYTCSPVPTAIRDSLVNDLS